MGEKEPNGIAPKWLLGVLACPRCKTSISLNDNGNLVCSECRVEFPKGPIGQPDMRLSEPLEVSLPTRYDPSLVQVPETLWTLPAEINAKLSQARGARGRPEEDVKAWLVDSIKPGSIVLDLGAKSNRDQALVESFGAQYVAIELTSDDAMVLGDAHAIPLSDESVDLLLCMSVIEHLKNPFLAAQEMRRVLKPKCRVIGIVGFIEALHGLPHGSFFHHSHFGIYTLLTASGFEVEYLAVSPSWQAIHSIGRAMMPGLRASTVRTLVKPLQALQDMLWFASGIKNGSEQGQQAEASIFVRFSKVCRYKVWL